MTAGTVTLLYLVKVYWMLDTCTTTATSHICTKSPPVIYIFQAASCFFTSRS